MTEILSGYVDGWLGLTRENLLNQEEVAVFLGAGDRYLRLGFLGQESLVTVFIKKLDQGEKFPGVTTLLYSGAYKIMQEASNILSNPLTYGFSTANPSMKTWALSVEKGQRIFNWDRVLEEDGRLLAFKKFYPQDIPPRTLDEVLNS